jgi:hypothetical protein
LLKSSAQAYKVYEKYGGLKKEKPVCRYSVKLWLNVNYPQNAMDGNPSPTKGISSRPTGQYVAPSIYALGSDVGLLTRLAEVLYRAKSVPVKKFFATVQAISVASTENTGPGCCRATDITKPEKLGLYRAFISLDKTSFSIFFQYMHEIGITIT